MKILVIPTTDWIRHPVPNRLNFIFDALAEEHEVYVLHFELSRFRDNQPRHTSCTLVPAGTSPAEDPSRYYLTSAFSHLRKIREVVKDEGIDVILSANILPSFMANFAGVPIVFDYLDHLEESASIYYPGTLFGRMVKLGVSLMTRQNLLRARTVITVTEELKVYLQGIGVSRVEVIPNGVDTSLLQPMPQEEARRSLGLEGPVLGYVGSLEHWVDLETVVTALPRLKGVNLLVIGPGLFTDYGDKIKALARDQGVDSRIRFTGAVPYSELGPYISAMDIGLNPLKMMKKNEYAAGGKVFNYLSCGRPVLSSRMVSLERLLGDQIYYYDDVEGFVHQVGQILQSGKDPAVYRELALKYDWRALARVYEGVLQGAL
ncbi:MAG: glycosyltransferase family 4 protein [Methanosarcinales archaeon]|nr:glycosyltransferase family 4 protein [Methanosarcinales archaeon]